MTLSAEQFIAQKEEQFQKDLGKKKIIWMKDISREGKHGFLREAWTFMMQHNLETKVFVIERLRKAEMQGTTVHKKIKIGDIEYRIGYYIVGHIRKAKGHWMWGQFCPLIPQKDFDKLMEKARKEKTAQRVRDNVLKNYYNDQILKKLRFKKGAYSIIRSLSKQYKLAIGSGEKIKQIERYLKYQNLNRYFQFIGHGGLVFNRKSNPD